MTNLSGAEADAASLPPDLLASEVIRGLGYYADFLKANEATEVITRIDAAVWSEELSRRVQHYGYRYDYKARKIDEAMRIGRLPDWLRLIAERLVSTGQFDRLPDQVIVNEYQPGQGIAPHIDCKPCFGDTVASITLGSGCLMDFMRGQGEDKQQISVWLAPGSLIVLKGEARYRWKHGIAKRRHDIVNNESIPRARRLSLTFRCVQRTDGKALLLDNPPER